MKYLLALLLLTVPTVASAVPDRTSVPPACTAANVLTTCAAQTAGNRARVTDADDGGLLCTGGGTTTVVCEFDGSNWLPETAGVVPENSIGPDELAVMSDKIVLCGQDANSGTIYLGPSTVAYLGGGGEQAIGGVACTALDSATETTADAPISAAFPAFKVSGMQCISSTDAANDQVLTLRSAAADLTPSVTCTIAGTGTATGCSTTTATTTDIAAGATIAVQSVNTEDLSAQDVWCQIYFAVK